jgi:DNA-binding response OmpR family regulator
MSCCPTCGQGIDANRLIVSLEANQITRGGVSIHVTPLEAEYMHVLAKRYPACARRSATIAEIYGAGHEPSDALSVIRTITSRLRRKLKPIGVEILNVQAVGYRLALSDEAAV